MPTLYTIGHSTHPLDEFISILHAHQISILVDVRSIPKSRRVPWFNQAEFKKTLKKQSIRYIHLPILGGLRRRAKDSPNKGWYNASFQGYADYMQTHEFFQGLKELNQLLKKENKVAIMCAESLPWRCHRSLIADAEVVRHITVLHIMSKTQVKPHELTDFSVVDRHKRPIQITYPRAK